MCLINLKTRTLCILCHIQFTHMYTYRAQSLAKHKTSQTRIESTLAERNSNLSLLEICILARV